VIEAVAGYGLSGSRLTFPSAALAQESWEQLLELAVNHRVAGHLMRAVDDGALPVRPEQRIQAFHASRVERDYGRRVEQQLLAVAETFDTAGIDWRVLKGAAHAHLAYPAPELRSYVDIDILVPADHMDAAIAELQRAGGVRRYAEPRPGFDRRFSKGVSLSLPSGIDVDLHRTLAPGPFGVTVDLGDLFATTSQFRLGNRSLPALGAEERLLHACFHAMLGNAAPRLTPLRDVVHLQVGVDIDRTRHLARRWRADVVLGTAVEHAARTFDLPTTALGRWARGEPFPRRQRRALALYRAPQRTSAVLSLGSLAVIPGVRSKVAYAWAILLPQRDVRRRSTAQRWRRGVAALWKMLRSGS
jgi:hypothetical protein